MAVTAGILTAAGLAAKGAGLVNSYNRERQAQNQLNQLRQNPMARYQVNPLVRGQFNQAYGEASNPQGYTGAQTMNFRQQLGSILRQRYRNAMNVSGGSGARGVNAVLKGNEIEGVNNFAAGDPTMANRRYALGRVDRFANQFQGIDNNNVQTDQNYRLRLESALGNSLATQRNYRQNLISGVGDELLGTAGYMSGSANPNNYDPLGLRAGYQQNNSSGYSPVTLPPPRIRR